MILIVSEGQSAIVARFVKPSSQIMLPSVWMHAGQPSCGSASVSEPLKPRKRRAGPEGTWILAWDHNDSHIMKYLWITSKCSRADDCV